MTQQTNVIHCGDNLHIMQEMEDESVDLIYLDPPFFSNRHYEVIWGDDQELRCFDDHWKGGIEHYIGWMSERLKEMYQILKPTGSIYLHCDWHAVFYLKVEMDKIFGMKNFKNQITWQRSNSKNNATKKYNEICDYILFYTKTDEYTFKQQYIHNDNKGSQPIVSKASGRFYCEVGTSRYFKDIDKTITLNDTHGWRWKQEKIDEFLDSGGEFTHGAYPRKIMSDKKPINNIWCDIYMHPSSKEILGYPTQKPKALLERIIETSSNEGDIILDPFCGCGTALDAAKELGRQYIGIDVSPTACPVIADRLGISHSLIIGMPVTYDDLKTMDPNHFQQWVCTKMNARNTSPNPEKGSGGDGGVDGTVKSGLSTTGYEGAPIQIKRSSKVGVNVVKNFFATMHDLNKDTGFIVALSFGKGAVEQVAKYKNEGSVDIVLVKAEDIAEKGYFEK